MADYYSVIARAVSRLPSKTNEARHAIYERARTAVQESLRRHDPQLSPAELATEQLALEAAISRVEAELGRAREEAALSARLSQRYRSSYAGCGKNLIVIYQSHAIA
jgi:uncharacterized membrane protein YccC